MCKCKNLAIRWDGLAGQANVMAVVCGGVAGCVNAVLMFSGHKLYCAICTMLCNFIRCSQYKLHFVLLNERAARLSSFTFAIQCSSILLSKYHIYMYSAVLGQLGP